MTLDRLLEHKDLTKAELKILDYITKNPSRFLLTPINEVAKSLAISEATMSRFVRHVGFKDYKDFKHYIASKTELAPPVVKMANTLSNEPFSIDSWFKRQSAYILQSLQSINDEDIAQAIDMIQKARQVYVFGKNSSYALANMAIYRLRRIGIKIQALEGSIAEIIEGMANIDSKDLVVYFAFNKLSNEAKMILNEAKKEGFKTIAITSRSFKPLRERADLELVVYRGEEREYHSQASAVVLIDALALALSESAGAKAFEVLERIHQLKKTYQK